MADSGQSSNAFPVWETVAIFVAIASLWPRYVLGAAHPFWKYLSYAMFALMAVIAVRRLRAFNRRMRQVAEARRRDAEEGQQDRARLPWEPPPQ
ncbi:MAG: hypothetical protein ACLF0G_08625 [Candidatus Brocadiia bacterium]